MTNLKMSHLKQRKWKRTNKKSLHLFILDFKKNILKNILNRENGKIKKVEIEKKIFFVFFFKQFRNFVKKYH